jgi:hypothetical protein
MPLRDHFRPPMTSLASWEELHGMWPGVMAFRLNALLPPEYRSGVKIHLGTPEVNDGDVDGGLAWEAAAPTLLLETDELTPPEYEVRVYDLTDSRRLVAAVELVSPRNKDRAEARDAFVSKCHALLQQDVCVVIVDPVTERSGNLFAALAERLGARRPDTADAALYAVSCRVGRARGRHRVETWEHPIAVGAPLPTLPLWISDTRYVPLELERTYEDTCRGLRIP